jgi:polyphosphate kinase 2 (PPK2 family)
MGKKSKNDKKSKSMLDSETRLPGVNGQPKIGNKEYEAEIFKLQVELVKLQEWVKAANARIVILFEGRDAAGKGGIIKRIMERVSPRIFRGPLSRRLPRGRRHSSMRSAISKYCPPEVKSSSSTGAGITAPVLST